MEACKGRPTGRREMNTDRREIIQGGMRARAHPNGARPKRSRPQGNWVAVERVERAARSPRKSKGADRFPRGGFPRPAVALRRRRVRRACRRAPREARLLLLRLPEVLRGAEPRRATPPPAGLAGGRRTWPTGPSPGRSAAPPRNRRSSPNSPPRRRRSPCGRG